MSRSVEQVQAIETGHLDIADDQIGRLFLGQLQALVSGTLEKGAQGLGG